MEYECIKNGLIHSQRSVLEARQSFLEGNLTPLLQLVADQNDVRLSPHLSTLLTDILTGTIKRPNHRPKRMHLNRLEIVLIGQRVDFLRQKGWWMTRKAAIETVANGSPAIEGLERTEFQEIQPIPKTRVNEAYTAFQQLQREKLSMKKGKARRKPRPSNK